MGRVAVTYRLMPESPEADLPGILEQVKASFGDSLVSSEISPFAFGLEVLEVVLVMDDAEGVADEAEETLKALGGIQSVEVSHLSLL
jgi:translation elongation factor aEF-1 beta